MAVGTLLYYPTITFNCIVSSLARTLVLFHFIDDTNNKRKGEPPNLAGSRAVRPYKLFYVERDFGELGISICAQAKNRRNFSHLNL
ncbi:hypothetical protein I8752_04725 [Nostocaceae cyanobacterium CENA369]|uniref:Uncharacterized protein n=1 Tax=Dendronalium phyllosphericum CENA369 TaxID=1725256 RepID=A0A8J7I2D1_9NOST|nr:hypothetical protein [Dendronalium phyllosphericum]MBH8572348.1 hypothetical protein [Dendronalium phyllosphericum CENA369]